MPMDKKRYPPNWHEISLRIRARDGWKCQQCGAPNGVWIVRNARNHEQYRVLDETLESEAYAIESECPPVKVIITVHHIGVPKPDGSPGSPHDKMDCRPENLVSLCQRCHFIADLPSHIIHARQARALNRRIRIARAGQMAFLE